MHNVRLLKASPKTFCLDQKKEKKIVVYAAKIPFEKREKYVFSEEKKSRKNGIAWLLLLPLSNAWDDDVDNVKKACTSLPAHYIKPSICMPSKYPKHNNNLFVSYCKTLFV